MADDIPSLIVEILEQIRDGVQRTNERLDRTNERLEQGFAETNRRLSKLEEHAIETNKRLATVETVVTPHRRIIDRMVLISLNAGNRLDLIERRLATLEAK